MRICDWRTRSFSAVTFASALRRSPAINQIRNAVSESTMLTLIMLPQVCLGTGLTCQPCRLATLTDATTSRIMVSKKENNRRPPIVLAKARIAGKAIIAGSRIPEFCQTRTLIEMVAVTSSTVFASSKRALWSAQSAKSNASCAGT